MSLDIRIATFRIYKQKVMGGAVQKIPVSQNFGHESLFPLFPRNRLHSDLPGRWIEYFDLIQAAYISNIHYMDNKV